ncbi:MAG TPA: heme-binding protein [Saliniramus sp.]|nr:heme-binding protein [Saliniramus sp.]
MPDMNLETAQTIVAAALKAGREKNFLPLAVCVYDARGSLKALLADDGASLKRSEIAMGKAYGAIALGVSSRTLGKMAVDRPHFIASVSHVIGGPLTPTAGGVLIRNEKGELLGAIGVSGDVADNDEIAALAGVAAAGLVAETGA